MTRKWVKLGEYKSEPNFALGPNGEQRPFELPQDTPAKMHDLMQWFKTETDEKHLHPVIFAAEFHHRFVRIHPFDDGNGRMARILMNLILMQNGYQPVIIKTNRKQQYVAALIRADVGELADFLSLIAEEEINSEDLFLRGAKGEDISEFDDIDKQIAILKRELSDIPPPEELTNEVSAKIFSQSLRPIFSRFHTKMSQFNEFYKNTSFRLSGAYETRNQHGQIIPRPFQISAAKIEDALNEVERGLVNAKLRNFQIQCVWSGFKRAGTNVFDDNVLLGVNFQQYVYTVWGGHQTTQLSNPTFTYPNVMTDEQITKAINSLAESCLMFISQKVGKKLK